MQTNVTVKGQVTIPKAVRDRTGIHTGARVEVDSDGDGNVIIRQVAALDVVERDRRHAEALAVIRKLRELPRERNEFSDMTTDEYMAMLRDPLEPFELDGVKLA